MNRYHCALTLSGFIAGGTSVTAGEVHVTELPDGSSRSGVYAAMSTRIADKVRSQTGHELVDVCVLFWSVEPDTL